MSTVPYTPALAAEYGRLWRSSAVLARWSAEARETAEAILRHRARYEAIAADPRAQAPWWWIGCIHHMECSGRFDRHLANGDPLTARTKLVPAGLPKEGRPPFTFEQGAIAALALKNVATITDWSIEHALYQWELYNGFGYRLYHPDTLSPYLWSGTPHYRSGKFVKDHKWSTTTVSGQIGAAAILLALIALCPDIGVAAPSGSAPPPVPTGLEIGARGWQVESVQRRLADLGYPVGRVDGRYGDATRDAVLSFQARNGLPTTGKVDDTTKVALDAAQPKAVAESRAMATAADVADHPAVQAATATATLAKRGGVFALLAGIADGMKDDPAAAIGAGLDKIDQAKGLLGRVSGLFDGVVGWAGAHPGACISIVVAAVCVMVVARANGTIAAVVDRFRAGHDMG